jgi:hypothetical protein
MYYGHVSSTSNREDWTEACVLTDADTGDLIDISQCRVTMTLRNLERRRDAAPGIYNSYYDRSTGSIILMGSTDTGEITLPDVGTFQWSYPETSMCKLIPGEYEVGVRISQIDPTDGSARTMQLIIGSVDVIEGIDNQ